MSKSFNALKQSMASMASGNNQSIGKNSSTASSAKSMSDTRQGRYQDDTKVHAAIKMYSSLDGMGGDQEDDTQEMLAAESVINDLIDSKNSGNSRNHSKTNNKNFIRTFEKIFLEKLFKINHVMLSNQAVSTIVFHIILFLSFAQILFNIFYKVNVYSEFTEIITTSGSIQNGTNQTELQQYNGQGYQGQSVFRIEEYFTFINFQFYVMQGQSKHNFLILYGALSGILLFLICSMFAISGRIFDSQKSEDSKDEGSRVVLKVQSFILCLYLYLLQIPLTTLLFQGYLCDENSGEMLEISNLKCSESTHHILTIISTLILTIYIVFLLCEQTLFSSNSFEIVVPWASYERQMAAVRILIKFVISIGFMFDKKGSYRGIVNLVLFFLQSFQVIKRYRTAIIFDRGIYYATLFYESVAMWLYLTVSIHILSDTPFSVFSLTQLILVGFAIATILIIMASQKRANRLITQLTEKEFNTSLDYMIYFYRFYEIIESSDPSDLFILNGKLRQHMQICQKEDCKCMDIADYLDELKLMRNVMEKEFKKTSNSRRIENTGLDEAGGTGTRPLTNFSYQDQSRNEYLNQSVGGQDELNIIANSNIQGSVNDLTQDLNLPQPSKQNTGTMKQASFKESNTKNLDKEKDLQNKLDKYAKLTEGMTWLQQKRKLQRVEDSLEQMQANFYNPAKIKKQWYKLLSIFISEAIGRYPKNIDLRVINAYVQKSKLKNDFKAIFEMMNCELCSPTIYEKFVIFRKKIEVEQSLYKQYQKNIAKIGVLDVVNVFNYEKWFSKYQLYEHLATFAAQQFWRELLQKQVDASILQVRGNEISQCYEAIQDIAKRLCKIYPDEIKFLFRYGNFLLKIIHNEYDAVECYEKARIIFMNRINKRGTAMPINEQTIFGENSATAIVLISASSTKIGHILHANEEIEEVLGFNRKEIIGQNVTCIIPRPIAKAHDRLIQRYFETAKPNVIDLTKSLFGCTSDGYLREVTLQVKTFPQINEKIVFVGLIKRCVSFEDMEPPKSEYERYDREYIICDKEGNITNVTQGLYTEMGLHPKFFNYTDSIFQQMFSIQRICPDLFESDSYFLEQLETEGMVLTFDTRNILNFVELESLNSEEVIEVKANLGVYQAYVQLKKFVVHQQYCTLLIYRVIMLSKQNASGHQTNLAGSTDGNSLNSQADNMISLSHHSDNSMQNAIQASVSSMASSTTSMAFNRVVKDFKKSLGERTTPMNLVYLNRITVLIVFITITLSSIDYATLWNNTDLLIAETNINLMTEERSLGIIQASTNVRSFVNIANGLEFDTYQDPNLASINRFNYLRELIQTQGQDLQEINEAIIRQFSGYANQDGMFEDHTINLFRLDGSNQVNNYTQSFKVGMQTFLNLIQTLNSSDQTDFILPKELFQKPPVLGQVFKLSNQTSELQKSVYFIMSNGMRDLRLKSSEASAFHLNQMGQTLKSQNLLAIMIVGLVIIFIFFGTLLYQIWNIEQNKTEILSLYAHLTMEDIQETFYACDQYMTILNSGSLMKSVGINSGLEEEDEEAEVIEAQQELAESVKNPQAAGEQDDVSDDEKDAKYIKNYRAKKRLQRKLDRKAQSSKDNSQGQVVYEAMIKQTLLEIRDIADREEKQHHPNGTPNTPSADDKSPSMKKTKKEKAQKIKGEKQNEKQEQKIKTKEKNKLIKRKQSQISNDDNQDKKKKKGKMFLNDDDTQSQNSSVDQEGSEDYEAQAQREAQMRQAQNDNMEQMSMDEIELRKKSFRDTIKSENLQKIVTSLIAGSIFIAYFVSVLIQHNQFETNLDSLNHSLPLLLNRYRYSILSYSFMRERILANNSLSSFEIDDVYGYNLDNLYNDHSIEVEGEINVLEGRHSTVLEPIMLIMQHIDSTTYCSEILSGDESKVNLTTQTIKERIHNFCQKFEDGIFQKGFQQALSNFHKRFTDLFIKVSQKGIPYNTLLTLLSPPQNKRSKDQTGQNSLNSTSLQFYFTAQELYFYDTFKVFIKECQTIFSNFITNYFSTSEIIFLVFLGFQLIVITIVRSKLINQMQNDIFKSRGILNLIPDNFFETNRQRVENIIKKLKD